MSSVAKKLLQIQPAAGGAASDDEFENVTLLLDGEGSHTDDNDDLNRHAGSGTITYQQSTRNQGSFSPLGDNWSVYFDGSSHINVSSATALGTGNFTVEFWINTTDTSFNIMNPSSNTGNGYWGLLVQSGDLRWNDQYAQTNLWVVDGAPILDGKWHHVAIIKNSNVFKVFYDGVSQSIQSGSFTDSYNYPYTTTLRVGSGNLATFKGYLSNIRLVSGTAIYSSNFTPPTEAFTNSASYTEIALICHTRKFVDDGNNNRSITLGSSPKIKAFGPFKGTEARTIDNYGGSFQFTNYASQNRSRNSTYTFEAWLYFGAHSAYEGIICFGDYSQSGGTYFYRDGTDIRIYHGNALTASYDVGFKNNEWRHVVLQNNGGNHYVWVDGEYQGGSSGSTSASFYYHFTGYYGGGLDSGTISNVYVSDMRLVNASVYTQGQDFTLPTSPLTAISNTDWLYNYGADANIASFVPTANIETIGNSSISTSASKYGNSAIYFSGNTTDKLVVNDVPALGEGDFTIEFWVYFVSIGSGTIYTLLDGRNNGDTTNLMWAQESSGSWTIFNGAGSGLSANWTSGTTFSSGSWYHVAQSRESGVSRFFVNGSQTGGNLTDTSNYDSTTYHIGGRYSVGGNSINGYINDFRMTRGVARYTSNFTPPSEALPKF